MSNDTNTYRFLERLPTVARNKAVHELIDSLASSGINREDIIEVLESICEKTAQHDVTQRDFPYIVNAIYRALLQVKPDTLLNGNSFARKTYTIRLRNCFCLARKVNAAYTNLCSEDAAKEISSLVHDYHADLGCFQESITAFNSSRNENGNYAACGDRDVYRAHIHNSWASRTPQGLRKRPRI